MDVSSIDAGRVPAHTPGPWLVDPDSPLNVGRLADDGSGFVVTVCLVDGEGLDEDNIGQGYADAALIAASPDLASALAGLLAAIAPFDDVDDEAGSIASAEHIAREALRRAGYTH